jgi:Protein of unknown function (DUF4038)/Putative collagen-binding domain of a collagenase
VRCDAPAGRRFVTSISTDGRYFRDQNGAPLLVRGDSPWAGMTRWSTDQASLYFANRERFGFNASIMSLIGATANGAPGDDGATFDGVLPFVDGDVTRWNEPYWQRVDTVLRTACLHGNTIFLYPVDGWNVEKIFRAAGAERMRHYATMVAERYGSLPNVVWMAGGDFWARDRYANRLFSAMLDGIRSTGNIRPFSIQLWYTKSLSTDSPEWRDVVDWNFVYTYQPTYRAVLDGYLRSGGRDPRPALLGEANYEGENNVPGSPPTTNETLRRQALWALTSGSPGNFFGSSDWKFAPGWEGRLATPAVRQLQAIRDFFAARSWWRLVPDGGAELVTAGRGTAMTHDDSDVSVLGSDYATVARAADGSWAVVYVPTDRALTLDLSSMGGPSTVAWVDPAAADRPPQAAVVDPAGHVSTPGPNSDGGHDWLLLVTARHPGG